VSVVDCLSICGCLSVVRSVCVSVVDCLLSGLCVSVVDCLSVVRSVCVLTLLVDRLPAYLFLLSTCLWLYISFVCIIYFRAVSVNSLIYAINLAAINAICLLPVSLKLLHSCECPAAAVRLLPPVCSSIFTEEQRAACR